MLPTVSVIIPTHNRRNLLPRAIESVLAQQQETVELIVVDDGSTDDTPAYLEEMTPSVQTIRMTRREGQSVGCNAGLALARSDLVMFLDDDDWLWPNALARLASALRKEPHAVAAVGARWDWFTQESYERRDAHPRWARTMFVFDELLFGWSPVSGQNLYRVSVLRNVGGFMPGLMRCQDRDLWLRVARQGPVVVRPEIVMTYRWHPAQTRLVNIRELREWVARAAIRELPRRDRRRAFGIRKSTLWFDIAQDAIGAGRYVEGVTAAARAVAASPTLFLSPLIWPLFVRRLAGRLWHRLRGR